MFLNHRTSLLVVVLMLTMSRPSIAKERTVNPVLTCDVLGRAGGPEVTYKGAVSNSDYRFDVTIPDGLIGWGSADGAPFHGFAIFMDKSSCILFLIKLRLDLPGDVVDPPLHEKPRRSVRVGNRNGLESTEVGKVRGIRYLYRNVWVELPHEDYFNDATIILVTPVQTRASSERLFRRFLAGFNFW